MFSCCFKRDKQQESQSYEIQLEQEPHSNGDILDSKEKNQVNSEDANATNQPNKFKIGPDLFVTLKTGSISNYYKIEKALGEGTFGSVQLVVHLQTGNKRVLKQIRKDNIMQEDEESMLAEVNVHKELNHPNIVKLYELFQDSKNYYLIMEYLEGGELFEKIKQLQHFSEKMAADYMKQILSSVMYCHDRKIVHRDIKPENILFENNKKDSNIKVIDFGTSRKLVGDQKLRQRLGTPYYIAPEVLKRNYNEKCDVWSCGVILYIMLCGYPPFGGEECEILKGIEAGKYEFERNLASLQVAEDWSKVSEDAKSLISKMLEMDPAKRLSAKQAYQDPWIQKNAPTTELNTKALKNLNSFHSKNKLRAVIIQFITVQLMSNKEKMELKKAFMQIDKNGDGQLSKVELFEAYSKQFDDIKANQLVDEIFEKVDVDKSGYVDFTEFIAAATQQEQLLNKRRLEQTFKIFDINGDGFISREELQELMGGVVLEDNQWQEMLQDCDKNNDGKISQAEFTELLLNKYN